MNMFEDGTGEEFEAELRRKMTRIRAPEKLTGRVMARVAQDERRGSGTRRVWLMPIAAMLLLVLAGSGVAWQRQQERKQEAIVAQQQFELAMRLTERSLDRAQARLEER